LKYVDEYRDPELVRRLATQITKASTRPAVLMEVCGSHTMAIRRFGIPALLPEHISLISGPGCPVCVTEIGFIDRACDVARRPDVTVATFGDLLRVPGSTSSLERERAAGADIRVVPSSRDALVMAREAARDGNGRRVVFMGIGFETTTPTTAAAVVAADDEGLDNFLVLSAHKTMKPAMLALCAGEMGLDGFLCPGHVSVVTGASMYEEIVTAGNVGCVVAGFEPTDVLSAVLMLLRQIEAGVPKVEIAYKRAVGWEGSAPAQRLVDAVFAPRDAVWRGLGTIEQSGLGFRDKYRRFDAEAAFEWDLPEPEEPSGCRCGEVLTGRCSPGECPLFGDPCTPETPVGACMVSSEGTCAAHYRYAS
jgi:hydrogenase expression/formation protein HypD